MRHTLVALVAVITLVVAAGAVPAYAIGATADIPFPFVVKGQTLPAGKYEIEETSPELLTIRSMTTKAAATELMVITRLAATTTGSNPKLVFDKVGERDYLSEVWLPDQDGFLVLATKGPHTHRSVGGMKK